MKITTAGLYAGRTAAPFVWWDDALEHARWLAARDRRRYRVLKLPGSMTWQVRPAIVRGGGLGE